MQSCNPSYLGSWDLEDHSSRSARPKSSGDPHLEGQSWAWWHMPVIPATAGSINRRTAYSPVWAKKQWDPFSKITRAKTADGDWNHICNPSYLGGRDQEDHSLKPAWANSSLDPISKKSPSYKKKRAGGVAQGEGPEFKPQYCQRKINK
jgi:hypothetical protein